MEEEGSNWCGDCDESQGKSQSRSKVTPENLSSLKWDSSLIGKYTVEFLGFKTYRTEEAAPVIAKQLPNPINTKWAT